MADGGTKSIEEDNRVTEKLNSVYSTPESTGYAEHSTKISIDDGYVEYSFDFDVGDTHSIHTLLGMICGVLGVKTPPKGEMRDRNMYTSNEVELAFFNYDTNGSELSCEDFELKRREWKSFKEKLHKNQQKK